LTHFRRRSRGAADIAATFAKFTVYDDAGSKERPVRRNAGFLYRCATYEGIFAADLLLNQQLR
jgi:hypothetical protein